MLQFAKALWRTDDYIPAQDPHSVLSQDSYLLLYSAVEVLTSTSDSRNRDTDAQALTAMLA